MNLEVDPKKNQNIDPIEVSRICYETYRQFSQRKRMMTHEAGSYPYCNEICDMLALPLSKKYPDKAVRMMGRTLGPTTGHAFIEIQDSGEVWVLDPTWQQFINYSGSKRHQIPSKPMVMWVKRSELASELMRLGVPENIHHIWLEASLVRTFNAPAERT